MEENIINDVLKEKIDNLGADTIMGSMAKTNDDNVLEKIDKLNEAVAEAKNKEVEEVALGGSNPILRGYLPKTRPIVRDIKKIQRNDPCPCGAIDDKTGKPKKYKNCCMDSGKYETTHFN